MNLFRSEEHVRRWSLYQPGAEDYVMPVADWATVFAGPMFRRRLDPDYLAHADEYLTAYHDDLRAIGKASPFWQYPLIEAMDTVRLSRYRVVGAYARYEEAVLNELKDARNRIAEGLREASGRRENHLIWAAPGGGKTFFVEQIASALGDICTYTELNLARLGEEEIAPRLAALAAESEPQLVLVDEIDARPDEGWPFPLLMPHLDANATGTGHIVFVLAGSSGFGLDGMKQRLARQAKGADMLSRIPEGNQFSIASMSFGDRILIALSQFAAAGRKRGQEIRAVEKLGLYYIGLDSSLVSARQLQEFISRAVERAPRDDDRVKYDHLFAPGDPENKRFWLEVSSIAAGLTDHYVVIDDAG